MGLLSNMADATVTKILQGVKDSLAESFLQGVGRITHVSYKNKQLTLSVLLDGLDDHEITAVCRKISIGVDGDSITLSDFNSNMPFATTLLNRYLANTPLPLPEGNARVAAKTAKGLLGL